MRFPKILFILLAVFLILPALANAQFRYLSLDTTYWAEGSSGAWENIDDQLKFYGSGVDQWNNVTNRLLLDFVDSDVYVKWKVNGEDDFNRYGLWISKMLSAGAFTTDHSEGGSTVIDNDTWYYTRMSVVADQSYSTATCTGNYDDEGGSVIYDDSGQLTADQWAYARKNHIRLLIADNESGTDAWMLIDEVRTNAIMRGGKVLHAYDFQDEIIPDEFTVGDDWVIGGGADKNLHIDASTNSSITLEVEDGATVSFSYWIEDADTDAGLEFYIDGELHRSGLNHPNSSGWVEFLGPISGHGTKTLEWRAVAETEIWIDDINILGVWGDDFIEPPEFQGGWSMVSIPLEPDFTDPDSVFGDDLENQWMVYGFNEREGFLEVENVESGLGYWLLVDAESATIDAAGDAVEDTVNTLLRLGWNLIGDPYDSTLALDDMLFRWADTTYTKSEAIEDRLIIPVFWGLTSSRGYFSMRHIEPWHGYLFRTLVDSLSVLMYRADPVLAPPRDNADQPTPDMWTLNLFAQAGDYVTNGVAIGSHEEASDGFDLEFDFPTPPGSPDGQPVRAWFQRDDWDEDIGSNFSYDIRAPLTGTTEWTLNVQPNEPGEVVIGWTGVFGQLPENYRAFLIDRANNRAVDMMKLYGYKFECGEEPHQLTIRVDIEPLGAPKDVERPPAEWSLLTAYPNPFNATVNLKYGVSTAGFVSLKAYDTTGRLVQTLTAENLERGYHAYTWNAEELAEGLYLIRLETANDAVTQKVLLLK